MAKRKGKGSSGGMNPGQEAQLKRALKNSGLPDEEILKALPKLKKLIDLGMTPPSEIIRGYIEEFKEREQDEDLKRLNAWLEKNAKPMKAAKSRPPRKGKPTPGISSEFKEAIDLSQYALSASREEMQAVYQKLFFLRELASRTRGANSPVVQQLQKTIAPIEKELKKRQSFGAFIKEKAVDFRKSIPERLAAKIPIVGGLASEFLRGKRESSEELERLRNKAEFESKVPISKRGALEALMGGYGGMRGIGGFAGSVSDGSAMEAIGGTPASSIPGLGERIGGGAADTLGAIYGEVKKIRELLVDRFEPSTDELKAREAELEGKTGRGLLGAKTGAEGAPRKRGLGGLVSDLLDGRLRRTRLGRGMRKARIFGKRMMRGLRGFGRRGMGTASRLGRKLMRSRIFRRGRVAGKMLSRMGRGAVGKVGGVARSAMTAARGIVSSAASSAPGMLSKAGGFLSKTWGSVSGAVSSLNPVKAMSAAVKSGAPKIMKSVVSVPGLGALLSGIMGAIDISSIKNDPNLTPEEKKEQIGTRLVSTLGQALGSIGGGMLGSLIPVPGIGTLIGSMGGMWIGGKLAELLAEAVGPKKIYDMVASIPGVGSLIKVDSPEGTEPPAGAGAEGTIGEGAATTPTPEATGTISAPSTPNTSLGAMMGAHNAEMGSLTAAQTAAAAPTPSPTTNNAVVNSRVNNTVNNFNDDLRLRNNEPTVQQAQRMSLAMW